MRLRIEVQGVVQGVGFRPAVYRLALARGLVGSVWNHARGVTIEAQGPAAELEAFLGQLKEEVPRPAQVVELASTEIPEQSGTVGFQILTSHEGGAIRPVVPPDLALCAACAEIGRAHV